MVSLLVGRLVSLVTLRMVGRLVGWLVGRSGGRLVGRSVGLMVESVGWSYSPPFPPSFFYFGPPHFSPSFFKFGFTMKKKSVGPRVTHPLPPSFPSPHRQRYDVLNEVIRAIVVRSPLRDRQRSPPHFRLLRIILASTPSEVDKRPLLPILVCHISSHPLSPSSSSRQ